MTELNLGTKSVEDLWPRVFEVAAPTNLQTELRVVMGWITKLTKNQPDIHGAGRRLGRGRLQHLPEHAKAGTEGSPCQVRPLNLSACMGTRAESNTGRGIWKRGSQNWWWIRLGKAAAVSSPLPPEA